MVGGSWRAVAGLDMKLTDHPLPITHQHRMKPHGRRERAALRKADKDELRRVPSISSSRIPMLPIATQLLEALVVVLDPKALVVSSFGIREGLLYDELGARRAGARPLDRGGAGSRRGARSVRPAWRAARRWIAPAFDDHARAGRLRLAACLLADIGWAAHPDFRAERGIDLALHGNWVAIDAPGG